MKKFCSVFIGSTLLISSLSTPLVVLAAPIPTSAVMEKKDATAATSAMENKENEGNKVDYALPYPGILSDHPLYFLKKFRDWIVERLIADPLKKIEFYVRQSDKMLNSGVFLVARSKLSLAGEMLSVSSAYMEKAVNTATLLKGQGRELPGYMVDLLTNSLAKHEEVLGELIDKATEGQKEGLTRALEVVQTLAAEVAKLR